MREHFEAMLDQRHSYRLAFFINLFLLNFGSGYTVLFLIATVHVILGAILVLPIKSVR